MATGLTFTMEGKDYSLDDFELGELEWLESYIEKPLMNEEGLMSMKTMVGFVYLVRKREDPEFTIEQARGIKLSVLAADDEDGDRKAPAKKRPTKAAPAS